MFGKIETVDLHQLGLKEDDSIFLEPISDEQIVEHLDSVLTIMDVIEENLANEDPNAEVVEEEEGSDNEEWEWVEEE